MALRTMASRKERPPLNKRRRRLFFSLEATFLSTAILFGDKSILFQFVLYVYDGGSVSGFYNRCTLFLFPSFQRPETKISVACDRLCINRYHDPSIRDVDRHNHDSDVSVKRQNKPETTKLLRIISRIHYCSIVFIHGFLKD